MRLTQPPEKDRRLNRLEAELITTSWGISRKAVLLATLAVIASIIALSPLGGASAAPPPEQEDQAENTTKQRSGNHTRGNVPPPPPPPPPPPVPPHCVTHSTVVPHVTTWPIYDDDGNVIDTGVSIVWHVTTWTECTYG